jgi:hypothetical protein
VTVRYLAVVDVHCCWRMTDSAWEPHYLATTVSVEDTYEAALLSARSVAGSSPRDCRDPRVEVEVRE